MLRVVRGKPPEVYSQLELPAWGTKVGMGPAESIASTFAQSHTGFTKPFPFEIDYDPPQGDGRRKKVIRRGNSNGKGRGGEKVCLSYLPLSFWLPLFPGIVSFFSREYTVQN